MTLWGDLVNGADAADDLNGNYSEINSKIKNLKLALLGGFTEENLLAIVFHHQNQQCFHDIANALDGKLAVNREARISPKDVLEVTERVVKRQGQSNQVNVMAVSSKADKQFGVFRQGVLEDPPKPRQQLNARSKDWILKHISPNKPCFWFFEWGHWKQDCPIRLAGKPKQADPRLKDPAAKIKKSSFLSHPALAKVDVFDNNYFFEEHVAAVEDMKVFAELVLLDSGATHHVTNNGALFVDFQPINISLSVATAARYPVVGVGTVVFGVDGGKITLRKTLYCLAIAGTVLSVGRFQRCDGKVTFTRGVFQLIQDGVTYYSRLHKDQWFVEIIKSPTFHAIRALAVKSNLLHQRFAHFSLGVLARM
ncbi:hypothetical protein O181_046671 [Austropuccinia psidii MF-1]|uniref:Retrovirus-related Pol polyprotein from transposon TNT 1-94-like beta-barrel domain-containing protein n=1 Tax=Austropuccinia psidii MF-1 TaxID=1389203 RepID=A0A9Q3DMD5_9BASI|nr:hypothetical protein [Austropuccinia psidii MF-1]